MVKSTARRLKVFQAQLGFYDTVVAAPSQAAALRAWGVHQNLFAGGNARLSADPAAAAAATAQPGTVLRRAVGSADPFTLEPASLPKIPTAPKRPAAKPAAPAKPALTARPPADRSSLDAAEQTLRGLDDRRRREEAGFRREQDALEARRAAGQRGYVDEHRAATARLAETRTAYRKAGGTD